MPRRASKTSRRSTQARDREQRAFAMRKMGYTYQQIGDELGVTMQSAHAMVKRKLEELAALTAADAVAVRDLELERLDVMIKALWPKVLKGNVQAIDKAVTVMRRRAALLGLDAPAKTELSASVSAEVTRYEIPDNGRGPTRTPGSS